MLTKNIEQMKSEIAAHIAADAVVQGDYWYKTDNPVGGRGCFIGCLAHSSDATVLQDRFGLPLPVVRIAERIFENLPIADAKAFFAEIPEAIGQDGKDISRVHWLFLADTLRHLRPMEGRVKDAIDRVIAGMDLMASGNEWADAAARAAYAADAADAADAAAYAAARAARAAYAARAVYAARAAYYAADASSPGEWKRQSRALIELIKAA